MKRARVLLADDHKIVVEGLRSLLEAEFELAGAVDDGRALVAAALNLQPDVIVADISMPMLNGIEAARQLKKLGVTAKIIFLTMQTDLTYAVRALEAGASGYVLKHSATSELVKAIREVLKGNMYVTPVLAKEGLESFMDRVEHSRKTPLNLRTGNRKFCSSWPKAVRQRGGRVAQHFHPNGRVPQISNHGKPATENHGRTGPICHQAWDCLDVKPPEGYCVSHF